MIAQTYDHWKALPYLVDDSEEPDEFKDPCDCCPIEDDCDFDPESNCCSVLGNHDE